MEKQAPPKMPACAGNLHHSSINVSLIHNPSKLRILKALTRFSYISTLSYTLHGMALEGLDN